MNMLEVWLLLVFIPKVSIVFKPMVVVSTVVCIWSLVMLLINNESFKDDALIQECRERGMWTKKDEIRQQTCVKGLANSAKIFKKGVLALVLSSLAVAAAPDKKEIAAIVLIPYISDNPEFKKLPENIVGMLNDLIKEYRQELSLKEEGK